jgi:LacI family transcriptional regulator
MGNDLQNFRRILIPEGEATKGGYAWSRDMLQGISSYVASGPRWEVRLVTGIKGHVERINEWKPDGVLAMVDRHERLEDWLALRCPVVSIASTFAESALPCVSMDEHAIGQMAAEHLLERKFRNFGFVGYRHNPASEQRRLGFVEALEGFGEVHCLNPQHAASIMPVGEVQPFDDALLHWLDGLEAPAGVFAWNDLTASVVVQACARLGRSVPEQISVLGVDNDEVWCGLCVPPLSSVRPPSLRIGFEAAALLDRLMDGEDPPRETLRFPPESVEVRRSTDILAIDDPIVAAALSYIREHLGQRINVDDVIRNVPASRRVVEERFKQHLGRTPLDEIHRERLSLAQHLLRNTDLPLKVVADRAGYRDVNHFTRTFSKERGTPPATFRKTYRLT